MLLIWYEYANKMGPPSYSWQPILHSTWRVMENDSYDMGFHISRNISSIIHKIYRFCRYPFRVIYRVYWGGTFYTLLWLNCTLPKSGSDIHIYNIYINIFMNPLRNCPHEVYIICLLSSSEQTQGARRELTKWWYDPPTHDTHTHIHIFDYLYRLVLI